MSSRSGTGAASVLVTLAVPLFGGIAACRRHCRKCPSLNRCPAASVCLVAMTRWPVSVSKPTVKNFGWPFRNSLDGVTVNTAPSMAKASRSIGATAVTSSPRISHFKRSTDSAVLLVGRFRVSCAVTISRTCEYDSRSPLPARSSTSVRAAFRSRLSGKQVEARHRNVIIRNLRNLAPQPMQGHETLGGVLTPSELLIEPSPPIAVSGALLGLDEEPTDLDNVADDVPAERADRVRRIGKELVIGELRLLCGRADSIRHRVTLLPGGARRVPRNRMARPQGRAFFTSGLLVRPAGGGGR